MIENQTGKRIHLVHVRVNSNQLLILKEKANTKGFRSMSEFLRFMALENNIIIENKIIETNKLIKEIKEIINSRI